jgi:glutaconyl-CoA/methylmalonyl-CoA decarboxylase subunit delta
MSQIDGFAGTVALVGYLVVFLALVLLYVVFYNLPAILNLDLRSVFTRRTKGDTVAKKDEVRITGEVNAAIAMAMYLYMSEMHDQESGIITIKKVSRRYSPWSSKIYGLRQNPRH